MPHRVHRLPPPPPPPHTLWSRRGRVWASGGEAGWLLAGWGWYGPVCELGYTVSPHHYWAWAACFVLLGLLCLPLRILKDRIEMSSYYKHTISKKKSYYKHTCITCVFEHHLCYLFLLENNSWNICCQTCLGVHITAVNFIPHMSFQTLQDWKRAIGIQVYDPIG